jgi:hypothetical protein
MEYLANTILKQTEALPEGTPVAAKMLLGLGSRAGVDQALSRLHRRGILLRIGRGLYVRPIQGRFGKRTPTPESVIEALSLQRGETVLPSPASVANSLGLTTQVPVRAVFVTSGRSRKLTLGKQKIELRHAPTWQLLPGPSGEIVRALAWGGRGNAEETLAGISKKIPRAQIIHTLRYGTQLPGWVAQSLSNQVTRG